jgi:hypothetical protein
MNQSQVKLVLLAMIGAISQMPQEDQFKIESIKQQFKKIIDDNGKIAETALTMFTLELGLEKEQQAITKDMQ